MLTLLRDIGLKSEKIKRFKNQISSTFDTDGFMHLCSRLLTR